MTLNKRSPAPSETVAQPSATEPRLLDARDILEHQMHEHTIELQATASGLQAANLQLEELNRQLRRINQWLASAHQHMLSILNQVQVGVIIINGDGRVVFLNQVVERVFDRDHAHALGQFWEELLPMRDADKVGLRQAMELRSDRLRIPVHWSSPDGKHFWMELGVTDDPTDADNRIVFIYDMSEVSDLQSLVREMAQFHGLCGQSRAMQLVYKSIQSVARVDTTVLIEGETGTGKELVARAIHQSSLRKGKPFLAINCAGLTESLLTSQLFGHNKGAFTGAVADQVGLFEAAHGGTLFLDEVGDIPISIQSSLLRVLQEKEITRLGETRPRKVNVRIIAATHRDLGKEVALGNFRQDLFYRIRVAKLDLPPLREHAEDIEALIAWFVGQSCSAMGLPEPAISSEAMESLKRYQWPGNVRELKSAVESAIIHSNGSVLSVDDLPPEIHDSGTDSPKRIQLDEREHILAALRRSNGNRTAAAQLLGVSRATFYRALRRMNLDPVSLCNK